MGGRFCAIATPRGFGALTCGISQGHIRDSETPQAALVRELAEEIGVKVPAPTSPPVARIESEELDLAVYRVESWIGRVMNLDPHEHDRLEWFTRADLRSLQLAHPRYSALLFGLLAEGP